MSSVDQLVQRLSAEVAAAKERIHVLQSEAAKAFIGQEQRFMRFVALAARCQTSHNPFVFGGNDHVTVSHCVSGDCTTRGSPGLWRNCGLLCGSGENTLRSLPRSRGAVLPGRRNAERTHLGVTCSRVPRAERRQQGCHTKNAGQHSSGLFKRFLVPFLGNGR